MSSLVATALKPSSNFGKLTFNSALSGETESSPGTDPSTWAGRVLVVIGAASSTGQAAVAAFAAAGVHRIALVDSADTSAAQDVALRAASANNLPTPALLPVQLQRGGLASATHGAEEIRREWGHVDLVVHHADHEFLPVESTGGDDRVIAAQRRKSLGSGIENVYSLVDAFLPLLLSGSEKTLINIIPASSADTKPGAGAGMIAELANRGMADCLMVDHGREGLLAYSIHLSPGTYFADKGGFSVQHIQVIGEVNFIISRFCGSTATKWQ